MDQQTAIGVHQGTQKWPRWCIIVPKEEREKLTELWVRCWATRMSMINVLGCVHPYRVHTQTHTRSRSERTRLGPFAIETFSAHSTNTIYLRTESCIAHIYRSLSCPNECMYDGMQCDALYALTNEHIIFAYFMRLVIICILLCSLRCVHRMLCARCLPWCGSLCLCVCIVRVLYGSRVRVKCWDREEKEKKKKNEQWALHTNGWRVRKPENLFILD